MVLSLDRMSGINTCLIQRLVWEGLLNGNSVPWLLRLQLLFISMSFKLRQHQMFSSNREDSFNLSLSIKEVMVIDMFEFVLLLETLEQMTLLLIKRRLPFWWQEWPVFGLNKNPMDLIFFAGWTGTWFVCVKGLETSEKNHPNLFSCLLLFQCFLNFFST